MSLSKTAENRKQRMISIISFSLFSGWLLSFPFQGQTLIGLLENTSVDGSLLNQAALLAHFAGLFTSGFLIKSQSLAKKMMLISTGICIVGSVIFLLPPSPLWYLLMLIMAYFGGLVIGGWGFFYRNQSLPDQRIKTAANVLILANIFMIISNIIAVNLSPYISLCFTIILLCGAMLVTLQLEAGATDDQLREKSSGWVPQRISDTAKSMLILCLFIFIITINSGLMYGVVNPAFAEYELLASYYWAIPYIATLLIVRNLSGKFNKAYIMYLAMIMIGLSFTLFMWLDRSIPSYLLIDTLMLGAFGVCDLFWWSILGRILDYSQNPAKIFGIGLSMNVLGIILGGCVGNYLFASDRAYYYAAAISLIVIFIVLIILPILNNQLTRLLKSHPFLIKFADTEGETSTASLKVPYVNHNEMEEAENIRKINAAKLLTEREKEVVNLLLRGYTYKAIAETLLISENTLKYHTKNIYQKLNINSKMELIKVFKE